MKRLTWITGALILLLAGCSMLERQSRDPNSPLSQGVNAIDAAARSVQETAPAAGPYGWIAAAVATAVTGVTGAYKVHQKNQTIKTDSRIIATQQREYAMVRDTTKAIVEAIEQVGAVKMTNGDTIGSTVKAQVAEELKKRNLDVVGKAIISGIKAARANEAQKTAV